MAATRDRGYRRWQMEKRKKRVRETLRWYFPGRYATHLPDDPVFVGRLARSNPICSCSMCGNPRKVEGLPTVQERKANEDTCDYPGNVTQPN